MTNYILEYYQKIKDGSITVGIWIFAIYKYIVKGLEKKKFFFNAKKADRAIRFVENFCHHHEGKLAPERIELELWQKAAVSVIFGVMDDQGNRQFREIFIVIGRKNGKTLFAAAIAAYCTFLDGEYGGRIYFCAPKLQQANICFDAYYQMIKQEPELDAMVKKRRTDIYVADNNTSAMPLAFNAKKSDGLNPSLCIADEVSSWQGDAGLKFYEVIKSAFGARTQPLLITISTAGYIDEGIYDELMKRAMRFLNGSSKEKRFLPLLYIIDDVKKWNDINELQKSNPNLGVSISVDYLLEEISIAEGSFSKKAEFLTKYCNIKQNSSQAWLNTETVKKAAGKELKIEDFRHSYCVAGIDLSQTTDLTAVLVLIEIEDIIYVFAKFFLPEEKLEEAIIRDELPYREYIKRGWLQLSGNNYIDYQDCYNWLVELVEKYEILPLMTGYDRYSSQYLIKDLNNYGFRTDDVYQGYNLTPVINEAEGMLKDGKIKIGDNDLLKIHFLDSALKLDADSGKKKLVKMAKYSHVDGMAALLDALCVRQKWYEQIGDQLKNRPRSENRG